VHGTGKPRAAYQDVVSPSPPSERVLLASAREGDLRAYEELVRRHQQRAFRTACVLTGSAADAEDVVQEAFVRAWRALDRFRDGAPFAPWLLAIVARQAGTQRRTASRADARLQRAAQDDRWMASPAPAPTEGAVLRLEAHALLREALDRLPEQQRVVVELRYLVELSERETAAALRCRQGTVKSRLSRGLATLRAQMEEAP
jgi:RNA polymerase sigma-70 factor (ECF subfamily)